MTHTSGDVSIFVLHAGDLRRLKPGQILLPPCQGTPISWTLLQDPAPWTIHDALNPLNAHQPFPWHEQKRKQSAPALNEAPVGRSSHRRRPHQQPGKNLQSREEMLFLLRILIFSFKKNRMTELFLYLFLYDTAVNFYCCDGAFDGKLFIGHLNASSSLPEKIGYHQTSGAIMYIKENIAEFCTS